MTAPTPAAVGESIPSGDWQPITTAPTTGRVVWVDVWNGQTVQRAHYAYGGGEDQPPFGPSWFRAVRSSVPRDTVLYYAEITPQPTHWRFGSEGTER